MKYLVRNATTSLGNLRAQWHVETADEGERRLQLSPNSCSESAANLEKDRIRYETEGIFPKAVIDATVKKLKSYKDEALPQKLRSNPQKAEELIQKYLHCGRQKTYRISCALV